MINHTFIEKITPYFGDHDTVFDWITNGLQNKVLKCIHQAKTVYIRISDEHRRTEEVLQAELGWLHTLTNAQLRVPTTALSHCGNTIESIHYEDRTYFLVAFYEVVGQPIDVTNQDIWNILLFQEWGNLLGNIHRTIPDRLLDRPSKWIDSSTVADTIMYFSLNENQAMNTKLREIVSEITNLPVSSTTFGLIHNDFHQGNLLVHSNKLGVIDFDDCMYGWYAQDIAVSLYHAFWQGTEIAGLADSFSSTFLGAFIEGYENSHSLSIETIKQIPIFLRWREFFLYALFMQKWPKHNMEDWQTYTLKQLKNRIQTGTPYIHM